jgi:hypothetical protein
MEEKYVYKKTNLKNVSLGERIHVCGTITSLKGNILVLDDNTDTIRVIYKEDIKYHKLGDLVRVLGEIDKDENGLYIKPYITKKIGFLDELLWKFELKNI